ncbi:sulfurtransferase-like selenium metabolism protein YedF [Adlercreutzia sp. ZJ141]|uniref:sulfurtransferase-like selenium metabolism protein YedF n=1 Tax=Adlercreutzia sp. ZJ141 TaxID=2709406 RepID=UPI0013ECCFD8|nr:sulfurtransferase-like selenium metabolism protein YedF [Adlercreutzia sp. ZJ141]
MDMTVDALGDKCPLPVVKAKNALEVMGEGTLEVLVDNETAVTNLKNFAAKKRCTAESEQLAEAKYAVRITATAESLCAQTAPEADADATAPAKKPVVVISSNLMGSGDDKLGATLMKGFIFALTQQDTLPSAVLFYNSGVKLTCEGSESLDDLRSLADSGVTILSCGTCLQNFELSDKLAVGEPTNMYVIVETQMEAGAIIRP